MTNNSMDKNSCALLQLLVTEIDKKLSDKPNLVGVNSFRLFHGRGQCFPGLEGCCIDIFYPVALITVFDDYSEFFKNKLQDCIIEKLKPLGIETVLYQYRQGHRVDNSVVFGVHSECFYAKRNELQFKLTFAQQNIGFFLDIEPGRKWLEQTIIARDSPVKVLNMFAYTCVFSLVASAAGAGVVVNIDLSSRSLQTGRENYRLNNLSTENVSFWAHDVFKSWGKLKRFGPYDIVIIDPPSAQKGSFLQEKDYRKVWSRMDSLVAAKGQVLTCLNDPRVKREEFESRASEGLPGFEFSGFLSLNPDFPEALQGGGLKMAVYQKA